MSLTVPNDTEVIQREVKGGTEINCYLKENQLGFSEARRTGRIGRRNTQERNTRRRVA